MADVAHQWAGDVEWGWALTWVALTLPLMNCSCSNPRRCGRCERSRGDGGGTRAGTHQTSCAAVVAVAEAVVVVVTA